MNSRSREKRKVQVGEPVFCNRSFGMVQDYKPRSLSHPSRLFTLPFRAEEYICLFIGFPICKNETGGWMIALRHFQVCNAIEFLSLGAFCFSLLIRHLNLIRTLSSGITTSKISLSSGISTSKMTSLYLLYITIQQGSSYHTDKENSDSPMQLLRHGIFIRSHNCSETRDRASSHEASLSEKK